MTSKKQTYYGYVMTDKSGRVFQDFVASDGDAEDGEFLALHQLLPEGVIHSKSSDVEDLSKSKSYYIRENEDDDDLIELANIHTDVMRLSITLEPITSKRKPTRKRNKICY